MVVCNFFLQGRCRFGGESFPLIFGVFVTNAYQSAAKMNIRVKLQWARREAVLGLSLAEEVLEVHSLF